MKLCLNNIYFRDANLKLCSWNVAGIRAWLKVWNDTLLQFYQYFLKPFYKYDYV